MSDTDNLELNLLEEFPAISDDAWRAVVEADLKGAAFEKKLIWKTYDGLPVEPYYRATALDELGYLESAPGQAPWHRGRSTSGNDWTIVQEILNANPEAANGEARHALGQGAQAVCFVSEPCLAGIYGVNLQTLDQMRRLLRDLPLYRSAIHFRSGANALPVLANFLAALTASKADSRDIHGSVDYDPLATLVTQGEIAGSRDEVFFELANVLETAATRMPEFKVLSVQATHWLEAGGSSVQEVAFSAAAIAEYLRGLQNHGLSPEAVLPRMQLSFATGATYFMEIAKLRAARLVTSRVIQAFLGEGAPVPHTCIVARTADFNKAIYDPHTNLLRATTEAMSAALGGADAITVSPFDKTLRPPNEMSLRLSRNIQLLLKHEAYLDKVADPAAGSYLFETLTDSLASHAWELFQKVEGMGGFLSAAANGFLRQEVLKVADAKKQAIASRRHVLLGVNQYPNPKERVLESVDCESAVSELLATNRHIELNTAQILESLESAFQSGAHLSDAIGALAQKEVFVAQPVEVYRAASAYESIRLRTEKHEARTGATPTVFLFKMGSVAMRQARAGFAMNFFGCAGFNVADNLGFSSVDRAVAAAIEAESDIVVLCSSDEEYLALAQEACPKLREAIPNCQIVVAGYPKDQIEALKDAGVADFIHVRTVAQDALGAFQRKLGMKEEQ